MPRPILPSPLRCVANSKNQLLLPAVLDSIVCYQGSLVSRKDRLIVPTVPVKQEH